MALVVVRVQHVVRERRGPKRSSPAPARTPVPPSRLPRCQNCRRRRTRIPCCPRPAPLPRSIRRHHRRWIFPMCSTACNQQPTKTLKRDRLSGFIRGRRIRPGPSGRRRALPGCRWRATKADPGFYPSRQCQLRRLRSCAPHRAPRRTPDNKSWPRRSGRSVPRSPPHNRCRAMPGRRCLLPCPLIRNFRQRLPRPASIFRCSPKRQQQHRHRTIRRRHRPRGLQRPSRRWPPILRKVECAPPANRLPNPPPSNPPTIRPWRLYRHP